MKAAFLFSDARHTLHLINGRIPEHKPTAGQIEAAARSELKAYKIPGSKGWDFVGALKNAALMGPVWVTEHEPSTPSERTET